MAKVSYSSVSSALKALKVSYQLETVHNEQGDYIKVKVLAPLYKDSEYYFKHCYSVDYPSITEEVEEILAESYGIIAETRYIIA